MISPLNGDLLAELQRLSTPHVANALELLKVRMRNEGYTDGTIRHCVSGRTPMLGYAATVRIRCSNPRTDGRRYHDRTDWWNYLLTLPAPRVVVIQDVDEAPGTGAFLDEVHARIIQRLGCEGVVTNGTVRDLHELEAMGLPVFGGGLAVSHAYAHIVDFGQPVKVGGLAIETGDLLHGDDHGVISIPLAAAAQIPAAAEQVAIRERRVLDLCDLPNFSVEALRAAVNEAFD